MGATDANFLGHSIFPEGLRPNAEKVSALINMPMPTDEKQVRALMGGIRKRGVPTASAQSRSDGIGTVGTDEAVGARVAAVGGPGRGRGTRGGVLARLADGRGAPPGPKP